MKLPAIHGIIDRRILVNFTAAPDIVRTIIPDPFRPKIYKGKAIVGICLIRLKNVRPKGFPDATGISSENGAHRIAVEWEEQGPDGVTVTKEGVYIPRRDTSSTLNALAGGRMFPGKHHLAKFRVKEENGRYQVAFTSFDHTTLSIDARETAGLNPDSIFGNLQDVSNFFEKGAVGYSPNGNKYEGLKLLTYTWQIRPLEVMQVQSSFFEDETVFPRGSIRFDNALLMTGIGHEWRSMPDKIRLTSLRAR